MPAICPTQANTLETGQEETEPVCVIGAGGRLGDRHCGLVWDLTDATISTSPTVMVRCPVMLEFMPAWVGTMEHIVASSRLMPMSLSWMLSRLTDPLKP